MTLIELSKQENAFIQKNVYEKHNVIVWELCTEINEKERSIHCELSYDVLRKHFGHCRIVEKKSVALNFIPEPTQKGHITKYITN